MRTTFWLLVLALGFPLLVLGQKPYQARVSTSKILVHGTSNIHDWTSWVDDFSGKAKISVENGTLTGIEALSLRIPVKAIKSGKDAMDSNTYEALKASSFSHISYRLIRVNSFAPQGDKIKIKAIGEISIAGVKKQLPLTVYCKIDGDQISFTGTTQIKMTDYGVEPPTALFGTVSTGDALTIEFAMVMETQVSHAP